MAITRQHKKMAHLGFFHRMRNYHVDEANRLFIHGGFSSMHGPAREHFQSTLLWDRTLWEMALTVDKRIKKTSEALPQKDFY